MCVLQLTSDFVVVPFFQGFLIVLLALTAIVAAKPYTTTPLYDQLSSSSSVNIFVEEPAPVDDPTMISENAQDDPIEEPVAKRNVMIESLGSINNPVSDQL